MAHSTVGVYGIMMELLMFTGVVVIHNGRLRDNTCNVPDSVCKKGVLWFTGVNE